MHGTDSNWGLLWEFSLKRRLGRTPNRAGQPPLVPQEAAIEQYSCVDHRDGGKLYKNCIGATARLRSLGYVAAETRHAGDDGGEHHADRSAAC